MKRVAKGLALIIGLAMLFGMTACTEIKETQDTSKIDRNAEVEEETEESDETEETTEETAEETQKKNVDLTSSRDDYNRIIELTGAKQVDEDSLTYELDRIALSPEGIIVYAEGEDALTLNETIDDYTSDEDHTDINILWEMDKSISTSYYAKVLVEGQAVDSEQMLIIHYTDEETANEVFHNVVEDYCSSYQVDLNDLDPKEFRDTGTQGYFVINTDLDDYAKIKLGADASEKAIDSYKNRISGRMSDFHFVTCFYQSGTKVYKTVFITLTGYDFKLIQFILDDGFSNPFLVDNSDAVLRIQHDEYIIGT